MVSLAAALDAARASANHLAVFAGAIWKRHFVSSVALTAERSGVLVRPGESAGELNRDATAGERKRFRNITDDGVRVPVIEPTADPVRVCPGTCREIEGRDAAPGS